MKKIIISTIAYIFISSGLCGQTNKTTNSTLIVTKIIMTKTQLLEKKYVHEILPEIADSGKVISTRISIQAFGRRNGSTVIKNETLGDIMKNADVPSMINIKCEIEDKPGYRPRVACIQVLIKDESQELSKEQIESMEDPDFFKEGWW